MFFAITNLKTGLDPRRFLEASYVAAGIRKSMLESAPPGLHQDALKIHNYGDLMILTKWQNRQAMGQFLAHNQPHRAAMANLWRLGTAYRIASWEGPDSAGVPWSKAIRLLQNIPLQRVGPPTDKQRQAETQRQATNKPVSVVQKIAFILKYMGERVHNYTTPALQS